MQKTINIDGKDITFKFTLATCIRFKQQFGYDILSKLTPLISELLQGLDGLYKSDLEEIQPSQLGELLESVYSVELTDILNLIWAMAKQADDTIKEPLIWFEQFEQFPIVDIFQELIGIILPSVMTEKKLEALRSLIKIEK